MAGDVFTVTGRWEEAGLTEETESPALARKSLRWWLSIQEGSTD